MSRPIKKIIPYFLILIILVGLFAPVVRVHAQTESFCVDYNDPNFPDGKPTPDDYGACIAKGLSWEGVNPNSGSQTTTVTPPQGPTKAPQGFEDKLAPCLAWGFSVGGCLEHLFYFIFVSIPSFLLSLVAVFFNAIVAISLDGDIFRKATFINDAWAVTRDLSNLFFILILLYIAVKVILDLGGHDAKKMIAKVIIAALLINFSMFMTKVVIDASNILTLIFYNKINTETTNKGQKISYLPVTNLKTEKNLSGGMANAFKLTNYISGDLFENAKKGSVAVPKDWWGFLGTEAKLSAIPIYGPIAAGGNLIRQLWGYLLPQGEVPLEEMLGIMLITGIVVLFAVYCFLIAGMAFLSRLIELWILIIFSPFAIMSFSIPILGGVEYIGWEAWSKRLFKVCFMAPIFMFMLYFIFKLIQNDIFSSLTRADATNPITFLEAMLFLIIPALVILILLLYATKFAKKWSGELGEQVIKAGGLALGAAFGATALALTGGAGLAASSALSSKRLQTAAKAPGLRGALARTTLRSADYGTRASFDVRKIPGLSPLLKQGGLNIEGGIKAKEGGYEKRRADKVKARQERAKRLEVREDEKLKQDLNALEIEKQEIYADVAHDLEELDNRLKTWRERATDASRAVRDGFGGQLSGVFDSAGAELTYDQVNTDAQEALRELNAHKSAIKNGVDFTPTRISAVDPSHAGAVRDYSHTARSAHGRSINQLDDIHIPRAKHNIQVENRERIWNEADRVQNKWFWGKTNREAAHKLRMGAKIDEKGGGSH